jgi:tetratricopeptide (TPR) repeat protein
MVFLRFSFLIAKQHHQPLEFAARPARIRSCVFMSRLYAGSICLILSCLFSASPVSTTLAQTSLADAQAPAQPSTSLHGVVHDANARPVAGAIVSLEGGGQTLTTTTDRTGAYRFSAISEGSYTLHVKLDGYAESSVPSIILSKDKSEAVNITLEAKALSQQNAPAGQPQFFDEPNFTVAGVTDTTNLGGHGSSETILRSKEWLAKAAASLGPQPSSDSLDASSNAAIETSLRSVAEREPQSFEANHNLGKFLIDERKPNDGIIYLQRAHRLKPDDYDNTYELALAHFESADYGPAQSELQFLLTEKQSPQQEAESRHLLGQVDEKLGDALRAARELQRAAALNPSEQNLFDWGSELLLHRAAQPAVEVFTKGNRLFPRSVRMLTALGAAWYELGFYDKAEQRLCEASDLNPNDPNPYLVMGKMQAAEAITSESISERLKRFVHLQPDNATANYYLAVNLWKGRKSADDSQTTAQVKSLLLKSTQLDPKFGPAYLQLGIVYAEEKQITRAISAYQQAIGITPDLEDAHYRLAQAYRKAGDPLKAQTELQLYQKISKQKTDETERQRREVKQFVYELHGQQSAPAPLVP